MVAGNNLGVRRRNALVIGVRAALSRVRHALLLRLGLRRRVLVGSGAIVHVVRGALRLWWLEVRAMGLDVDVCDSAAFAVVGDGLVLVGGLGVLCDDVPGVEEAWEEAEEAEADVDEGVGATEAALDPDY